MNEARINKLLEGQSSTGRKVFPYVPIQEHWSHHDIHRAAMTTGTTSATSHAVRRALGELEEAGIIRQPVPGHFQRDAFTPKPTKETAMPPAKPQAIAKKAETPALDQLAGLSAEIVALAAEFAEKLGGMARRIEDVALAVEGDREKNADAVQKLQMLQSILKGQ